MPHFLLSPSLSLSNPSVSPTFSFWGPSKKSSAFLCLLLQERGGEERTRSSARISQVSSSSHQARWLNVTGAIEYHIVQSSKGVNIPALMPRQKSPIEPFSETFEFERGSSTRNSDMDQELWNPLLKQVETPGDTNTSYGNEASQKNASLCAMNPGEHNSCKHPLNQDSYDETKMENGWTSSLKANKIGRRRTEETRFEATNTLSMENVDINLNNNLIDNCQPFSQNSDLNEFPQNFDHNVGHIGTSSQVPEAMQCPHPLVSELLESEHVSSSGGSSNTCVNSSSCLVLVSEDGEGRPGSSLDGRHLPCKRKSVLENYSASGSSLHSPQNLNTSLNVSKSSGFLSGLSPVQLNPTIGTSRGVMGSAGSATENAESSHRNSRMRIIPEHVRDMVPSNPWHPGNTTRLNNVWSTHQPFSVPNSSDQSLEFRPVVAGASSQSQPLVSITPRLPRNVHPYPLNGASNSRVGSSSSSPVVSGDRSTASREETNPRSTARNNTPDHFVFVPTTDPGPLVQVSQNSIFANGSANLPGDEAPTFQVGANYGVHQSRGPTPVPHQNSPTHSQPILPESVWRRWTPYSSSASGGQSINFNPQQSGHSAILHDVRRQSGVGFRVHPRQYMRSTSLIDTQRDGVPAVPMPVRTSAAAREGGNRTISERIRNLLRLLRAREGLQFEDDGIFDRSVTFWDPNLLDRHRGMRLDVDNMSYEELVALEERIGDVSTGLSEEMVSKCLKLQKYSSAAAPAAAAATAAAEVEPCCICREEYNDGEEQGVLDCGHDFHTACIRQWLLQKNLCPICKTAALA